MRDGKLVAAAEEERFRRIKHWSGFPSQAIQYCLKEAGIRPAELRHVAINQDSSANFWRKVRYSLLNRPSLRHISRRIGNRRQRAGVLKLLGDLYPDAPGAWSLHEIEHHRAHLASAFYASPYEEAAVVSVDGFGDFASAAWGNASRTSGIL